MKKLTLIFLCFLFIGCSSNDQMRELFKNGSVIMTDCEGKKYLVKNGMFNEYSIDPLPAE